MEFLWFILIGACAGWLAGQLFRGASFGPIGNIIVGVIGAILGGWVFGLLGYGPGNLLGSLVTATVGAILLLAILRAVQRK